MFSNENTQPSHLPTIGPDFLKIDITVSGNTQFDIFCYIEYFGDYFVDN